MQIRSHNNFSIMEVYAITAAYMMCCMCSELVTWLVTSKEASDDEQAVIIGQGLLEGGLIHHGECV